MLGYYIEESYGCRTKPVRIDAVDLTAVHGHIFKLAYEDRFVAYKYSEGKVMLGCYFEEPRGR